MPELRIGEVAKRSGVAASAIRFYESQGLLPLPLRRSGRRVYDESALDRLRLIHFAKRAGFTVAEIKRLFSGFGRKTPPSERWRVMTEAKLVELDERIAEAERMKTVLQMVMHCHCPSLDDCSRAMRSSETEEETHA